MNIDIIKRINEIAPYIAERDLDDWVVPELFSHYEEKIVSIAHQAYGFSVTSGLSPVAKAAFSERAKAEIRSGLFTFLFRSEHWREGRDINPYIITCLNRLKDRIKWDAETVKKINVPVCPGCKYLGYREFLTQESKTWSCASCIEETRRLEIEKRKSLAVEAKLKMHKIFSTHSRTGFRCPECTRFIPESINGLFGIACPYPDCAFFGDMEGLSKMAHPVGLSKENNVSLQTEVNFESGTKSTTIQDLFESTGINPDVELEMRESIINDMNILTSVIDDQVKSVKRTNSSGTMMQKLLMYEAYQRMIKKYPEDMISYLVHQKQSADFPLQARIFLEYSNLMSEALPYEIKCGKDVYDVVSLTDPNIQLFNGISEFDATIRHDCTIPNNTTETYTGGRNFNYYGSCYIGMLIDVLDVDRGVSIKGDVDSYSFVQIDLMRSMSGQGWNPGTKVKVKHFRIIPHYEMGGLVYLQRIRKKIVDSTYYRIHGHKRIIKKAANE